MNISKLLRNFLAALMSQGVALLCSIVTTLAVPKILGVEQFGYWQYFILLTSYVSLFQFGINDGVYLRHGGETRSIIDKQLVKSQFYLSIAIQSALMIGLILILQAVNGLADKRFLFVFAALYMVVSNAMFFLGYVFQAMNETKLYSIAIVADRVVFLLPLLICIVLRIDNCYIYIISYVFARLVALCYCVRQASDILRVKLIPIKACVRSFVRDAKLGIVLSFANICSMLILGFARFTIESSWGISVFGEVSLALSMVNFILMFVSQLSMVLFPALRQSDNTALPFFFDNMRTFALTLLPVAFILYFPLSLFVRSWLPEYAASLQYFVFLMPIVMYEALADMVYVTFFKVRCEPFRLLLVNAAAFVCSIFCIAIARIAVNSVYGIITAAVVGLAIRAVLGDLILSKAYSSANRLLILSAVAYSAVFVVVNAAFDTVAAFAASVLLLCVYCTINARDYAMLVYQVKRMYLGCVKKRDFE